MDTIYVLKNVIRCLFLSVKKYITMTVHKMYFLRLCIILLLFLSTILFITCSLGNDHKLISKKLLADRFGDRDGNASEDELSVIVEHFKVHRELWTTGGFPSDYRNKKEIPFDVILDQINRTQLYGLLPNEAEFLKLFAHGSVRTPFVGIFVFVPDEDISNMFFIRRYFRAAGPQIGNRSLWEEKKIIY